MAESGRERLFQWPRRHCDFLGEGASAGAGAMQAHTFFAGDGPQARRRLGHAIRWARARAKAVPYSTTHEAVGRMNSGEARTVWPLAASERATSIPALGALSLPLAASEPLRTCYVPASSYKHQHSSDSHTKRRVLLPTAWRTECTVNVGGSWMARYSAHLEPHRTREGPTALVLLPYLHTPGGVCRRHRYCQAIAAAAELGVPTPSLLVRHNARAPIHFSVAASNALNINNGRLHIRRHLRAIISGAARAGKGSLRRPKEIDRAPEEDSQALIPLSHPEHVQLPRIGGVINGM
ncbi:hypothetical protein TARUN_5966 [Trichoderma arundinaceum]|uniref:Uncharacterized protein n=1 Tax=Trichoderma arundinaceum TaxID=490622 RepID=A0A395NK91_TRIAR|nr:hypothetical protein TARUN_5966 [Trichoderma arundinaceum]